MPRFSRASMSRLTTCDSSLQRLFQNVVQHFDCTIIEGHRPQEIQDEYYDSGASQVPWPHSKHNTTPSQAVDVAPYPIDWDDTERFVLFAGFVLGVAEEMGIRVRWGGDWDADTQVRDERFRDLLHYELGGP